MTLWRTCEASGLPGRSDVHVWRIRVDGHSWDDWPVDRFLNAEEQGRAQRFIHAADRRRLLASRVALRTILGRGTGVPPDALVFGMSPYGRPLLREPGIPPLDFNLSHSGELVLIAVAWGRRVGVDVEKVAPHVERAGNLLASFSPRERSMIRAVPSERRGRAILRTWTRKEAFIKSIGLGLSLPLDLFDVAVDPDVPAELLALRIESENAARWRLVDLPVNDDYLAALAVEGSGWGSQLLDWAHAIPADAPD